MILTIYLVKLFIFLTIYLVKLFIFLTIYLIKVMVYVIIMEDKDTLLKNYINENLTQMPLAYRNKIGTNNERYNHRLEFEYIKCYIDNFLNDIEDERFIVLPGIRGVGKSTLLFQVYEYLLREKEVPYNQILYISCDDVNDITECSLREITELYIRNHHDNNIRLLDKKIFLLVDESQYDKNWALSGKIIYDRTKNIFMIFTGSSALHLEYNADAARRSFTHEIRPIDYLQHLRLKYNIKLNHKHSILYEILFKGNIKEAVKIEYEFNNQIMKNYNFNENEWNNFLYYGGFPIYFKEDNKRKIRDKIVRMTKKVVEKDLPQIKNISEENRTNTNRFLNYMALIDSADVSQNKISNYLKTSLGNIETIINLLTKTHLIFHLEAYGTPTKRSRKSWKYYFATSSIKYALASYAGNIVTDKNKMDGILLETMIASKLYELSDNNYNFSLYYDASKKSNVDFIIHSPIVETVPIEVGKGKKDNRQILTAMDHYGSDFGIIISNKTVKIEKQDNIIYIPPRTFALL